MANPRHPQTPPLQFFHQVTSSDNQASLSNAGKFFLNHPSGGLMLTLFLWWSGDLEQSQRIFQTTSPKSQAHLTCLCVKKSVCLDPRESFKMF